MGATSVPCSIWLACRTCRTEIAPPRCTVPPARQYGIPPGGAKGSETTSISSWRIAAASGLRILSKSPDNRPDALTRGCLLLAAALPWYAVASGVFGLYFFVLLLVSMAGGALEGAVQEVVTGVLFGFTVAAALPLALLLLLAMPAGLLWAAFRGPPRGLAGRVGRVGCVASMAFAATYAVLIVLGYVIDLAQNGTGFLWWPGWFHLAVLLAGLAATWHSWRWLPG